MASMHLCVLRAAGKTQYEARLSRVLTYVRCVCLAVQVSRPGRRPRPSTFESAPPTAEVRADKTPCNTHILCAAVRAFFISFLRTLKTNLCTSALRTGAQVLVQMLAQTIDKLEAEKKTSKAQKATGSSKATKSVRKTKATADKVCTVLHFAPFAAC